MADEWQREERGGRGERTEEIIKKRAEQPAVDGDLEVCAHAHHTSAHELRPLARAARVEQELAERERAAREVEQHVVDVPARRRAPRPVEQQLRQVLGQRDRELDVREQVEQREGGAAALVARAVKLEREGAIEPRAALRPQRDGRA